MIRNKSMLYLATSGAVYSSVHVCVLDVIRLLEAEILCPAEHLHPALMQQQEEHV